MRHTHYTVIYPDGSKSIAEFGEIDNPAAWDDGFSTLHALLIVNRWNYIAQLTRVIPEYHYYLHTAEGAS